MNILENILLVGQVYFLTAPDIIFFLDILFDKYVIFRDLNPTNKNGS